MKIQLRHLFIVLALGAACDVEDESIARDDDVRVTHSGTEREGDETEFRQADPCAEALADAINGCNNSAHNGDFGKAEQYAELADAIYEFCYE